MLALKVVKRYVLKPPIVGAQRLYPIRRSVPAHFRFSRFRDKTMGSKTFSRLVENRPIVCGHVANFGSRHKALEQLSPTGLVLDPSRISATLE